MLNQRSLTNLPLCAEFAVLTLVVTAASLVLGLLIRGFVSGDGSAPLLMRTPTPQVKQVDEPQTFEAIVGVVRARPQLQPVPTDSATMLRFDGRPIRPAGRMSMLVTAYSPDERSCGKWADGITASGYSVWTNGMKLVAADTGVLPFGTIVTVPGYHGGQPVQVLDRGGKIKGPRLDVLYPTHEIARRWGVQRLTVTVWEYAD